MRDFLSKMLEQGVTLDLEGILLSLGVSIVIGLVIFLSYWITHSGTIYSKKFNVSLVMLTILTSSVMAVIGNNVALSLGMVGALSIVRFRTAIKDSRDTVYIFWSIVAGISSGAGEFMIASLSSAALFIMLLFLGRIKNDNRRLLIIRAAKRQERTIESAVFSYFKSKANLRVLNSTRDSVELIYELSGKTLDKATKGNKSITETLYEIDDVEYVNVVTQNDEIDG